MITITIFSCLVIVLILIVIRDWPRKTAKITYRKGKEAQFQKAHHEGQMEFRLNCGARVDDLTRTHAIEYDFAVKWAEGLGQSLFYAAQTNRQAGIVLIMKCDKDKVFLKRLMSAIKINRLRVDVWTVTNFKDQKVRIK